MYKLYNKTIIKKVPNYLEFNNYLGIGYLIRYPKVNEIPVNYFSFLSNSLSNNNNNNNIYNNKRNHNLSLNFHRSKQLLLLSKYKKLFKL